MLKFIYILCGLIECLWISADGNGVRANESITEARENSFFALYFFHWGEIYPSFDPSLKSLLNVRRHGSVLIHWFQHAGTRCRGSRIRRPCKAVVPALQFARVSCSSCWLQKDFPPSHIEISIFYKSAKLGTFLTRRMAQWDSFQCSSSCGSAGYWSMIVGYKLLGPL